MQVKMRLLSKLKIPILLECNFNKMIVSLFIRILSLSLSLLSFVCPAASLRASAIDSSLAKSEDHIEMLEVPRQMTQKQMNDLLGEDPYLGQTSYLQSPDGFNQRDKSK